VALLSYSDNIQTVAKILHSNDQNGLHIFVTVSVSLAPLGASSAGMMFEPGLPDKNQFG